MANSIADAYRLCSASNGGRVECANRFRMGACGVFSDVHNRHAFSHCKRHSVFRQFQELVQGPVLSKKKYGGGAKERACLNRNTKPLGDFDDWKNIVSMST